MQLKSPSGGIEVTEKRGLRSKLFYMGLAKDGRKKYHQKITPAIVHVPTDFVKFNAVVNTLDDVEKYTGGWEDESHDLIFTNGLWHTGNCYYDLEIDPKTCGYKYTSKRKGDIRVTLDRIGGVLVNAPTPVVVGNRITWENISPGIDIYIICEPAKVEIFKRINIPLGRKAIRWKVREGVLTGLRFKQNAEGYDNANRRTVTGRRQKRRPLEITTTKTIPKTIRGKKQYAITEHATGRVRERSLLDPTGTYTDKIEYPIVIDADISESIVADADDGYGDSTPATATWNTQYKSTGNLQMYEAYNQYPGFRYTTIAVGQGDTIDAGTLLRVQIPTVAGTNNGTLRGDDVDNAGAWADGDTPTDFAGGGTTANLAIANITGSGEVTWNVVSIVQEIVNRASWASNNAMRFGFTALGGSGYHYLYIGDYSAGGSTPAVLEINFTAAAGGNTLTLAQTEASETNSVSVAIPINLTNAQSESSESQSATLQSIIKLILAQTESSEVNLASLQALARVSITQVELSESNSAIVQGIIDLVATQTETGETNSAALKLLSILAMIQVESSDINSVSLVTQTTNSLTIAQIENGEVNSCNIEVLLNLVAVQVENSETNSIALQTFINLTLAQVETSEINSAFLELTVKLTLSQTETSETNLISLEVLDVSTLTITQVELSESQSNLLEGLIQINSAQVELSETQIFSVEVLLQLIMNQVELSESQILLVQAALAGQWTTKDGLLTGWAEDTNISVNWTKNPKNPTNTWN